MAGGGPSLPNETPLSSARSKCSGGGQHDVKTEFDLIKYKNQD